MNLRLALSVLACLGFQSPVFAAETTGISPTGSLLKMVLGLAVVLAVMALISWCVKRMMPGGVGQQSAVRIVGGASVGSRERVVVLEIADRWIVVGVAPGQVNAIANLEIGTTQLTNPLTQNTTEPDQASDYSSAHPFVQPLVKPFSEWLKKSSQSINDKFAKSKSSEK